jgi:hypothetical protein
VPRKRAIAKGLAAGIYELTVDPGGGTAGNARAIDHALVALKRQRRGGRSSPSLGTAGLMGDSPALGILASRAARTPASRSPLLRIVHKIECGVGDGVISAVRESWKLA